MKTFTDDAIILRRYPYGERDVLFVMFAKYTGKIRAVAKGVRSITSRRGGHLDLFNVARVTIRESSGLGLITEAQTVENFGYIKEDKSLVNVVYYISELVEHLIPDEEPDTDLFNQVIGLLTQIDSRKAYHSDQLRNLERYLLKNAGFWSDEDHGSQYPKDPYQRKIFMHRLFEEVLERTLNTKGLVK